MDGYPRTKPTFAGWLTGSGLGFLLEITSVFAAPSIGMAMDFRLADHTIYATGAIEKGDADKLAQLVRSNKPTSGSFDENYYTVRLNSPGGLLLEGMKIGSVIRDAALGTLISRGEECASACALAFLGGTSRYATGTGIGRQMEFGAALGFHGFRPATDLFRMESETLSASRVVTALILEYAAQMKRVDLGWLSQTLNVPPDQLHYVRSPADFAALSIRLVGMPDAVPRDWYLNLCRLVVSGEVPALDAFPTPRLHPAAQQSPLSRRLGKLLYRDDFKQAQRQHSLEHFQTQMQSIWLSAVRFTLPSGSRFWTPGALTSKEVRGSTGIDASQFERSTMSP